MTTDVSPSRILLVDDDEINNYIATKLIKAVVPNVQITTTLNGKQAIDYLIQTKCKAPQTLPSHIFLDINMPVLDAWGFLEAFNSHLINKDQSILIYIISSSVFRHDIQRAKTFTCVSDFITKPLNKEKIKKIFEYVC